MAISSCDAASVKEPLGRLLTAHVSRFDAQHLVSSAVSPHAAPALIMLFAASVRESLGHSLTANTSQLGAQHMVSYAALAHVAHAQLVLFAASAKEAIQVAERSAAA